MMNFNLLMFYFITYAKKRLPNPDFEDFFPTYSSERFIIFALTFKSVIHWGLIFCAV